MTPDYYIVKSGQVVAKDNLELSTVIDEAKRFSTAGEAMIFADNINRLLGNYIFVIFPMYLTPVSSNL